MGSPSNSKIPWALVFTVQRAASSGSFPSGKRRAATRGTSATVAPGAGVPSARKIEPPRRLVSSKLTDYTLGLYASSAYLEKHGTPRTIDDLREHRRIGYVEDLIFTPSLNFSAEIMRSWDASFEISSATGQTEAVRSGAGIGILHNYIARQDPDLVRILPDTTIRRAYWTTFHESARDLARVRTVTAFVQELVESEQSIFV